MTCQFISSIPHPKIYLLTYICMGTIVGCIRKDLTTNKCGASCTCLCKQATVICEQVTNNITKLINDYRGKMRRTMKG